MELFEPNEAQLSDLEDTNLNISDIDNLKDLTNRRLIEKISGDIVDHIAVEG